MRSSPSAAPTPPTSDVAPTLLDASALLAVIFEEAGANLVRETLRGEAIMSAVNVGEVAARLHQEGWTAREIAGIVDGLQSMGCRWRLCLSIPRPRCSAAGIDRRPCRSGWGLGDRACLATAGRLDVPVLTADRVWTKLNLQGVTIRCIR